MKTTIIFLLLQCAITLMAEEETRDLDIEDGDDLGRKHRKRKKHQQYNNPCFGGYGRTFGAPDYTYISAPVNNYYFGCGGAPIAPLQVGHQGHQGHQGHHGHHGHQGHQGHQGHHGQQGQEYYNQGGYPPVQGYYQPVRPFQNVVSAASAGFGSALVDYLGRPKKIQRQINQFLRPIYKLF